MVVRGCCLLCGLGVPACPYRARNKIWTDTKRLGNQPSGHYCCTGFADSHVPRGAIHQLDETHAIRATTAVEAAAGRGCQPPCDDRGPPPHPALSPDGG